MEIDRGGNDKVRCAVVDTNVLMYVFLKKVDVIGQLRELGYRRFIVPKQVVEELRKLEASLAGKEKRAAGFALTIVQRNFEVIEEEAGGADVSLISLAKRLGCVLITNDRELKKKAIKKGIQVGCIRGMSRVEVEE